MNAFELRARTNRVSIFKSPPLYESSVTSLHPANYTQLVILFCNHTELHTLTRRKPSFCDHLRPNPKVDASVKPLLSRTRKRTLINLSWYWEKKIIKISLVFTLTRVFQNSFFFFLQKRINMCDLSPFRRTLSPYFSSGISFVQLFYGTPRNNCLLRGLFVFPGEPMNCENVFSRLTHRAGSDNRLTFVCNSLRWSQWKYF